MSSRIRLAPASSDHHLGMQSGGCLEGCLDTAGCLDVILLDQDRIEEAGAMIVAAAAAHRVLLGKPQAGDGLARVQNPGGRVRDGRNVGCSGRRGSRQGLQEVERGPFAGQQGPCRPDEFADDVVGVGSPAVADVPVEDDAFIQLPKDLVDPRFATDNQGFAGHDLRADHHLGGDQ